MGDADQHAVPDRSVDLLAGDRDRAFPPPPPPGKPHVGGQGVYTRHLTKALVDLGHHVEVFSGQPYPVLDDRVPLTKLPSLDIFNDHYPGRFPAYWEFKTREDVLELASSRPGTFTEPLAFSYRRCAR